jgi:hypothetical protein
LTRFALAAAWAFVVALSNDLEADLVGEGVVLNVERRKGLIA